VVEEKVSDDLKESTVYILHLAEEHTVFPQYATSFFIHRLPIPHR
jgi:hypothetical protein